MVGWHPRLDGHGFGWTPGVGDGHPQSEAERPSRPAWRRFQRAQALLAPEKEAN